MKIKLYLVQEVINASNPEDCVGPLSIFTSEEDRNWFFASHVDSEYSTFQVFEQEIIT